MRTASKRGIHSALIDPAIELLRADTFDTDRLVAILLRSDSIAAVHDWDPESDCIGVLAAATKNYADAVVLLAITTSAAELHTLMRMHAWRQVLVNTDLQIRAAMYTRIVGGHIGSPLPLDFSTSSTRPMSGPTMSK